MKRYIAIISVIALLFGLLAVTTASASAEVATDQIQVTVTPARISTSVGDPVDVTVTLLNGTSEPLPELATHLDVTDPRTANSVDPEDWTPTLTRLQGPLGPGEQLTESWTITPISGGDCLLYVVAVDADAGVEPATLAMSNGVPVHVDERRSFNPQGVLPLSIAMPALIGLALIWRHRRLRTK